MHTLSDRTHARCNEVAEYELRNIVTNGRKEVPQGTNLKIGLGRLPGTVTVRLRLPDQATWKVYPNFEIRNGKVELPVTLVFLSYTKEDTEFVRSLANRLLQDGILTWFDKKDLLPGHNWKREIDEGIDKSAFALVFLSSASVFKTGYFQRELKYALEQQQLRPHGARYISPIIIDDCQPPASLRDIHFLQVDQLDWYERLKRALVIPDGTV